jgi:hypothetical protein
MFDGFYRSDVVLEPLGLSEQAVKQSCRFLEPLR